MHEVYLTNNLISRYLVCDRCHELIKTKYIVINQKVVKESFKSKEKYVSEIYCQACWREVMDGNEVYDKGYDSQCLVGV
jgi:hypothetical protein